MRTGNCPQLFVTLITLTILAGCGGLPPAVEGLPHILLVTVDGLRPDHLGAYGCPRNTSPFIDRLAREGSIWTRAYTSTLGTTASHATLLSGLYQETSRVALDPQAEAKTRTEVPYGLLLLPGTLRQHGYRTAAVTDGGNASEAFGFDGAFDDFDDEGGGAVSGAKKLARLVEKGQRRGRPVFAWWQTYEVHPPWPARDDAGYFTGAVSDFVPTTENLLKAGRLSPEDMQLVLDRYDSAILRADLALRMLFAELERIGALESCIVVLTSAHGETFGEHGRLLARDKLYEELVHVPLILWGSGIKAGREIDSLIGSADIPPTLIMRTGLPVPELMKGRDLYGISRNTAGSALVIQYGDQSYAVFSRWRKLIAWPEAGRRELYDLYHDPDESDNIVRYYPEAVRPYVDRLAKWKEQYGSSGMVDRAEARFSEEQAARLKHLLGPDAAGAKY